MASTDSRPVPRKNAAFRLYTAVFDTAGGLISGGLTGVTVNISQDGGSFAAPAGGTPAAFTEVGTSGCGYIELTAADMNADHVKVRLTVTNTDAVDAVYDLYPEETGDIRANVTQINSDSALIAKFAAAIGVNRIGTVTGTPTLTEIRLSDVNNTLADVHNAKIGYFLTGALENLNFRITDYVRSGADGVFTIEPLPTTPSAGDTVLIL